MNVSSVSLKVANSVKKMGGIMGIGYVPISKNREIAYWEKITTSKSKAQTIRRIFPSGRNVITSKGGSNSSLKLIKPDGTVFQVCFAEQSGGKSKWIYSIKKQLVGFDLKAIVNNSDKYYSSLSRFPKVNILSKRDLLNFLSKSM